MGTTRQQAIKHGWRSGLEERVAKELTEAGIGYEYESVKVKYDVHETRTYTPDFILKKGYVIVETKGRFTTADRKKHLLIKKQHPKLDIRFVFQNSRAKLYKGAKSTYADWCDKHGFQYADKSIPEEWLHGT
jgi:hypothetical protein